MATLLDFGIVKDRVAAFQSSLDVSDQLAFSYFALDTILSLSTSECESAITDGHGDRGVDAIHIADQGDKTTIHLFQFKYTSRSQKLSNNFPSSEIDKVLSFIGDLLKGDNSLFKDSNNALKAKVREIHSLLSERHCHFEIHLCSNGEALTAAQRLRLDQCLAQYRTFAVTEHDLIFFSEKLAGKTAALNKTLKIHVLDENYFERSDGCVRGLIGTVRGATSLLLL